MQAPELWSDADRMAVAAFDVAVRHGDLAGALLALDGLDGDGPRADLLVVLREAEQAMAAR